MSDDPKGGERRFTSRGLLLPIALGAAVLAAVTVLLATQSSGNGGLPKGVKRTTSHTFAGATAEPLRAAPPIDLRNHLGRRITLDRTRGKVVLVTFLYTHCPDVCPLITSNLHLVQAKLGPRARQVEIVAVSVDPHGDTPEAVTDFLRAHDMTGRMQYLIGSPAALARTWKAWNVGSKEDTVNPELVAHSALVYGISASGKLTTLYPANFKAADIVHDVPLLARG